MGTEHLTMEREAGAYAHQLSTAMGHFERTWHEERGLAAVQPFSPANLQADMLAKYPDKTAYEPPIPYDYAVYYGKDLTPSREFT